MLARAAIVNGRVRGHTVRLVLGALVVVHAAAFALYLLYGAQTRHLQLMLAAREEWRSGELDAAARDYRRFVAGYRVATTPLLLRRDLPGEASGWFALGRIETERGHVDAALAAFENSMRLEPGRGRREYRDLLLESNRGAALVRFASAELDRNAGSAVAWWDLGAALLATGEPLRAAAAYRNALARLPSLLAAHGVRDSAALSAEEADLRSLESAAWYLAGNAAEGAAACQRLQRREAPGVRLDRLCAAFGHAAAGDTAGVAAELRDYHPPGPEHEALLRRLGGAAS